MLTRDRLCEAIGIEPEIYIDTLAWAMKNPATPEIVSPQDAPVFDNMQDEVDLTSLPIPYHCLRTVVDICRRVSSSLKSMDNAT